MPNQLKEWSNADLKAGQNSAKAWESFFRKRPIDRVEEINETARITEIQDKYEAELLVLENVVGVAAGLEEKAGKPTKNWVLTVFVEKKLPQNKVPKKAFVPSSVDRVRTDVVEVGKIEALAFDTRIRPAVPGFSIGHPNITAGTFGCLVRDIRRCCCNLEKDCCCSATREECPGDYLILSNNHVIADLNQGKPGDLILQPGPIDGGVFPSDGCAKLERFEPIQLSGFSLQNSPRPTPGYNLVDAAVARPIQSRDVSASIIGVRMPQGVDQALFGMRVIKVGRTSQVTTGFVTNVNATMVCGYEGGTLFGQFRHQIVTTPMLSGGDSGSLLMDLPGLNAVGLGFCGSSLRSFHNHIADVETALGVRPLTASRSS